MVRREAPRREAPPLTRHVQSSHTDASARTRDKAVAERAVRANPQPGERCGAARGSHHRCVTNQRRAAGHSRGTVSTRKMADIPRARAATMSEGTPVSRGANVAAASSSRQLGQRSPMSHPPERVAEERGELRIDGRLGQDLHDRLMPTGRTVGSESGECDLMRGRYGQPLVISACASCSAVICAAIVSSAGRAGVSTSQERSGSPDREFADTFHVCLTISRSLRSRFVGTLKRADHPYVPTGR